MDLRIKLKNDPAAVLAGRVKDVGDSVLEAFAEGAAILRLRGRAAIAAGGLGPRFAGGLSVRLYPNPGRSPRIFAYHKIKYAGQFQDPEPVIGDPLLWLPITKNLPLQPGGKRWTPEKYIANIGPLKKNRNVLFGQVRIGLSGGVLALPGRSISGRKRYEKAKKVWLPLFIGVRSVSDPKRFDLGAVAEKVAGEIGARFKVLNNG